MALRAKDLGKKTKSSTTTNEVLIVQNTDTNQASQFPLNDVFPMLQDGGTASGSKSLGSALGTSTTTPLFVGGGFGSSITGSDKNTLIFKGVRSNDTVIEIKNETLSADPTKGNIVIDFNQSLLDLNQCSNSNSNFLSQATLSNSNHVTGTLPVANGGTNATALLDKAVLVSQASGTDTLRSLAMSTNGQLLIGGTSGPAVATLTAGSNVTITPGDGAITIAATLSTLSTTLDTANNNIDLGSGFLSGDGSNEGIQLDTSGKVFIGGGTPTSYFTSDVNIKSTVSLGSSSGDEATSITAKPCTSGSTPSLSLLGSSASGTGNKGGDIIVLPGTGDTNGNGGDLYLNGGVKAGSGTDGSVKIRAASADALVVDANKDVTVSAGSLIITSATEGIVHTGSGTVTQATNHSTAVTLNASSGVITLAGVALAAGAEADFAVTNSTVQSDSVILLTVQSPAAASATNNATLIAQLDEVNNGSFNVRLTNPGAADTSTGAHKIHFLVINNSV